MFTSYSTEATRKHLYEQTGELSWNKLQVLSQIENGLSMIILVLRIVLLSSLPAIVVTRHISGLLLIPILLMSMQAESDVRLLFWSVVLSFGGMFYVTHLYVYPLIVMLGMYMGILIPSFRLIQLFVLYLADSYDPLHLRDLDVGLEVEPKNVYAYYLERNAYDFRRIAFNAYLPCVTTVLHDKKHNVLYLIGTQCGVTWTGYPVWKHMYYEQDYQYYKFVRSWAGQFMPVEQPYGVLKIPCTCADMNTICRIIREYTKARWIVYDGGYVTYE